MLVWENNSCYINSLITILLFSNNNFWISKLFKRKQYLLNFHEVISSNNKIITNQTEYNNFHLEFTKELYRIYNIMKDDSRTIIYPTKLMSILQKCINYLHTKETGWTLESSAFIYSKIAEIYPEIELKYKVLANGGKIIEQSSATIEYQNIVLPITEYISWRNYDYPILVFEVNNKSYFNVKEKILKNKYLLNSVLILINGHYSSIIRLNETDWMHYDDQKRFQKILTFKNVIDFTNNINMMFYVKV